MMPQDINCEDIKNVKTNIVEEKKIYKNLNPHMIISKAGIFAGIIKIPPKEERVLSFKELPRTIEDEAKIEDLITSLGIHSKLTLLLHHEKRLRKVGDEIRYLHPFKFLGYVFAKDRKDLKGYMAVVFDDYFKRTNFIKDFSQTMDIYDLKNMLYIYLEDFSKEVGIHKDLLKPYIDSKDWDAMVRFLINYNINS